MNTETFVIKSILVQNGIMAIVAAILLFLLYKAAKKRISRHIVAVSAWCLIVLWFFNGPLWGFSAVTVCPDGITLHYGILSIIKNTTLPVSTHWKIQTYLGGVRRLNRLYYLELSDHSSMKVQNRQDLAVLQDIGRAINRLNSSPRGSVTPHPVQRR